MGKGLEMRSLLRPPGLYFFITKLSHFRHELYHTNLLNLN